MLSTIFYFVLNMSLAACVVIAVLLGVRAIRPLPRRVIYPLWGFAFFRLIMPFTIATDWSLFNLLGGWIQRLVTVETVTQGWIMLPGEASWMNWMGQADQYIPIEYKTESVRQIFLTGSMVWVIGAAATLLTAGILYALTRRELRGAVPISGEEISGPKMNNLYRSAVVTSPVLVGLLRPRIILPEGLDPTSTQGQMVIAHEQTHQRRGDNLWRLAAIAITCLHWFNPLAWVMLKAFLTDMERSCDEAVIRRYEPKQRKAYAETLLGFAEEKRLLLAPGFGRSAVKVRITSVLDYQRMTIIGAVVSTLFLAALAVALLTNPAFRS
jgi:beta-lactamase regulating signal transducer with metallopeptidase domain